MGNDIPNRDTVRDAMNAYIDANLTFAESFDKSDPVERIYAKACMVNVERMQEVINHFEKCFRGF